MPAQMEFASAITTEPDVERAVEAVITQTQAQLRGDTVDFTLVFLSPHLRLVASIVSEQLQTALQPGILLGCTAEGVIGRGREVEREPALALVAGRLPGVTVAPFSLQSMVWETTLGDPVIFRQTLGVPTSPNLFVLLADPFTTPMEAVLSAFNSFYPEVPVVGGMASGSPRAGGNALLLNEELLTNGAVGLAMSGPVEIDVVVSQGCRPIGRPLVVTEAQDNVIVSLDGATPLTHLQHLWAELTAAEQRLLQQGLFVGRAILPDQAGLGRGDFLIRGVIGLDQERGALVIGDRIEPGETIQFHVRDATTAAEDLEMMLAPQLLFDPPAGGLLFSCNGRGTRLYDHPDGDVSTIRNVIGQLDLAGFFCAGEIGPIGGQNFLHGHTASLALFRPQQVEPD